MNSWYTIRAQTQAVGAEVLIYDEIGAYGVSAKGFLAELIPSCTDQHSCAHLRIPMDLMRAGWPISLFQALQQ